ncbi:hypothetical protein PHA77_18860 (plasmid) [Edwardsiella tarda]|uniref:hypothetical protein n=1 Tax=Edwardsiella tarda TaxID=636 RepID=UPI0024449148|nr:hypothetical protein [Edwardsiella tarda]WGE31068.1 hypothetical protein PHA77_18860 [Edwardsiella tarda]
MDTTSKKIFLYSTCYYELNGLYHILLTEGYNVTKKYKPLIDINGDYDLIIISLSDEALLEWGRYIDMIINIASSQQNVLLLVPEKICKMKVFLGICNIYSGMRSISEVSKAIYSIIYREKNKNNNINWLGLLNINQRLAAYRLANQQTIRGGKGLMSKKSHYYHRMSFIRALGFDNKNIVMITMMLKYLL